MGPAQVASASRDHRRSCVRGPLPARRAPGVSLHGEGGHVPGPRGQPVRRSAGRFTRVSQYAQRGTRLSLEEETLRALRGSDSPRPMAFTYASLQVRQVRNASISEGPVRLAQQPSRSPVLPSPFRSPNERPIQPPRRFVCAELVTSVPRAVVLQDADVATIHASFLCWRKETPVVRGDDVEVAVLVVVDRGDGPGDAMQTGLDARRRAHVGEHVAPRVQEELVGLVQRKGLHHQTNQVGPDVDPPGLLWAVVLAASPACCRVPACGRDALRCRGVGRLRVRHANSLRERDRRPRKPDAIGTRPKNRGLARCASHSRGGGGGGGATMKPVGRSSSTKWSCFRRVPERGRVLHDSALAAALVDRLLHHGEVYYSRGTATDSGASPGSGSPRPRRSPPAARTTSSERPAPRRGRGENGWASLRGCAFYVRIERKRGASTQRIYSWAKVKEVLRAVEARTRLALDRALRDATGRVTATDAPGWFRHCGYGVH